MKTLTKACARCHRLKVKCIQPDAALECQRCLSAGVHCEGRTFLRHERDENYVSRTPGSVRNLEKIVHDLSASVRALSEQQENRHSNLWRTLDDNKRFELFEYYCIYIAPGWPLIRNEYGTDFDTMQKHRPLYFRAACCAAMSRHEPKNGAAFMKEVFRFLCDYNISDSTPSVDLIEAAFQIALCLPIMEKDMFKILSGVSNLAHQTLQELDEIPTSASQCLDVLEMERCRLTVYLLCISGRVWQKSGHRSMAWGSALELATAALAQSDEIDKAMVACVHNMRIADGISFLESSEFSTEDIFRQYQPLFSAQSSDSSQLLKPGNISIAVFKVLNMTPLIEAYLDLFDKGDITVNVPLVFEALKHEGQEVAKIMDALRLSRISWPTFYYFRTIRVALVIAYLCRKWNDPYFVTFVQELSPIFDALIAEVPFVDRMSQFLPILQAWFLSGQMVSSSQQLAEMVFRQSSPVGES